MAKYVIEVTKNSSGGLVLTGDDRAGGTPSGAGVTKTATKHQVFGNQQVVWTSPLGAVTIRFKSRDNEPLPFDNNSKPEDIQVNAEKGQETRPILRVNRKNADFGKPLKYSVVLFEKDAHKLLDPHMEDGDSPGGGDGEGKGDGAGKRWAKASAKKSNKPYSKGGAKTKKK
jgi:hypothetical protein